MIASGCVAWILAGLSGPSQAAGTDPSARVLELLRIRTVDAFLHRSLLEQRGWKEEEAGGFIGPHGREYSVRSFPLKIGLHEEWPTVLGGTRFLLEPDRHARLLAALQALGNSEGGGSGVIERAQLQGELWAAFDGLLQDGVLPLDSAERTRWGELMEAVASAFRRLSLSDDEIHALPDGTSLREHLFRVHGRAGARPVAFHTLQTGSLHDASHRYRRVTRFYYWDPSIDFLNLDPGVRNRLKDRSVELSEGAVALLEEDAVLVTRAGHLVVTNLPLLYKLYRVGRTPEGGLSLDFHLYHIDPKASGRDPSALRPAGPDAEVWAKSNLPNIPGHGNKGPFRAPLAHGCSGCHNATPIAFRPTNSTLDPRHFVFGESPYPSFPAARVHQIKASSLEFEVLRAHLREEGRFRRFLPAPPPASAESVSTLGATAVGAGVCLLTFFALAARGRKKLGGKDPIHG